LPEADELLLVGHSGAGQLLPAIRQASARPVGAYVFVDAGIPEDRVSRLDQIAREAPEVATDLRSHLERGGRFPEWTDEDLRQLIPADGMRRGILGELRPRPLPFFTEPIPAPGWPDAPCGYLRFSSPYDPALRQAVASGWPTRSLEAGHFHMVVEPRDVVDVLLGLIEELSGSSR
jgi:hypothetical protein